MIEAPTPMTAAGITLHFYLSPGLITNGLIHFSMPTHMMEMGICLLVYTSIGGIHSGIMEH